MSRQQEKVIPGESMLLSHLEVFVMGGIMGTPSYILFPPPFLILFTPSFEGWAFRRDSRSKTQSARLACRIGCSANDPHRHRRYRRSRIWCSERRDLPGAPDQTGAGAARNKFPPHTRRP